MTTIDKHALCQLLAKWAGVEVEARLDPNGREYWVYWRKFPDGTESLQTWDPLTDANQMELVKAGLRKKGYGYVVEFGLHGGSIRAWVYKKGRYDHGQEGKHESESLALALAIQAMEGGR